QTRDAICLDANKLKGDCRMNKKLMAVAVAGALGAPAAALSPNTGTGFGKITMEYGYVDQGAGRPDSGGVATPRGNAGWLQRGRKARRRPVRLVPVRNVG